jgi:hypothetical protein
MPMANSPAHNRSIRHRRSADKPGKHVEQLSLTGSVRTDNADGLIGRQREVHRRGPSRPETFMHIGADEQAAVDAARGPVLHSFRSLN